MFQLEEKTRYLEHHWILAGKELDQEKMLREKFQKDQENDLERALMKEKEKCDALRKNYEKQLEAMKSAHVKQCDELGREILKATLEADRLHNQLVGSPRSTKLFTRKGSSSWKDMLTRLFLVSGVVTVSWKIIVVHGHPGPSKMTHHLFISLSRASFSAV